MFDNILVCEGMRLDFLRSIISVILKDSYYFISNTGLVTTVAIQEEITIRIGVIDVCLSYIVFGANIVILFPKA